MNDPSTVNTPIPNNINKVIGENLETQIKISTKVTRNIKTEREYDQSLTKDQTEISKPSVNLPNSKITIPNFQNRNTLSVNELVSSTINDQNNEKGLNQREYQIICEEVLRSELITFSALEKTKKIEFLLKLYQDNSSQAELILAKILPYVDAITIQATFILFKPKLLKNSKKSLILKRLSGDFKPEADSSLIALLLECDETIIANCNYRTLLNLRKKEYLGAKYYEQLSLTSKGKLTKQQHRSLSKLSARIATICYAFFLEKGDDLIVEIKSKKITNIKESKNLNLFTPEEKTHFIKKCEDQKIIDKIKSTNQADNSIDSIKNSIASIISETLKLKEMAQKAEEDI